MKREGWSVVRLSDVAGQRTEKTVSVKADPRPYIALEHLAQGSPILLGWSAAGRAGSAKTIFRDGDVLFGKLRPYLRKAAPAPFDGLCSTDILALFTRESLDPGYLSQLAQWRPLQRHAVATSSGTKMPRTSWAQLGRFEFLLPSLPEQRAIAAVLSSVDDAIEKTRAVIDQVQIVKRGLMRELLTRGLPGHHTRFTKTEIGTIPACWQVSALGDVLEAIEAGWSPKCERRPAQLGEWGVLKVSSVSSGLFKQHENKALHKDCEPNFPLEVKRGDVLVARASGVLDLVGRSAFVHGTRPRLMLSDKTLRLRPKVSLVRSLFLNLVLEDPRVRERVLIRTTGSHMRNISQRALRGVPVPVPCLEEQERIEMFEALTIARLEREREFHAQLEVARAGLMTVLLTGKLRVEPDIDGK